MPARYRQQVQELALLRRGLHTGMGVALGIFAQAFQRFGLAKRDTADVSIKLVGDGEVGSRHSGLTILPRREHTHRGGGHYDGGQPA